MMQGGGRKAAPFFFGLRCSLITAITLCPMSFCLLSA
jgi:hypothetical protein